MALLTQALETVLDASKAAWRDVLTNRAISHAITGAAIWGTWNWAQGGSFWTGALQGGLVGAGVGSIRGLNRSLASGVSELAETQAARNVVTSSLTDAELRHVLGEKFDISKLNYPEFQRRLAEALTPEAFSEWARKRFSGMLGGIGGFLDVHGSAAQLNIADLTPELAAERIGAMYRTAVIRQIAARSVGNAASQVATQTAQTIQNVAGAVPTPNPQVIDYTGLANIIAQNIG